MDSKVWEWLSLVGIIWVQSISGTNFNFPSYSSKLQQQLSMSPSQLNNLAFASDAGRLFGFIPGLAANYLPPYTLLFTGSFLSLAGYGVQYLYITKQLGFHSYPSIFILSVIAGSSLPWINTACILLVVQNFSPPYRHVGIGIVTSYQGLSANIYTSIVGSIFSDEPEMFLLLNSVLPLVVCLLVFILGRFVKVRKGQGGSELGFVVIFVIAIATGVTAAVTSIGSVSKKLPLVGILVLFILPLSVAIAEKVKESKRVEVEVEVEVENDVEKSSPRNGISSVTMEEIGGVQMVKKLNFWLYFGVYLFGATLGLAFLNNLGQIAHSRGISHVSSLVSLSSSFSFFGRFMPSLVEYIFSRSKYMKLIVQKRNYLKSRPGWLVALMGQMCLGFFLLICPTHWSLYVSTAIFGLCTGAISTISMSLTVDLFGVNDFSLNHNLVVANIPVGSFVYGYLAAFFYKNHALPPDGKCTRLVCYRTTFLLWGCFCCFGTFLAFILFRRTRNFYSTESQTEENSM